MRETIVRKLQQATCDKAELNCCFLKLCRCLKEVEKTLCGTDKPHKKK